MGARTREQESCGESVSGIGDFLRGLLAGIPWSERAEVEETRLLDAPRTRAVRLENGNGRTVVIGEDRDDLEVTLRKVARAETQEAAARLARSIRLDAEESDAGLALSVEIPRRWNRRGRIDVELRLPRGLAVELQASNGKVRVEGLRAALRTRSDNGAVFVDDVEGDVHIDASNAKVRCRFVRGRVTTRTSNAKVEISDHVGSLDASTSNGLIQAQIDELHAEGVRLCTSNGRIVLDLPEDADADVDVRVDNGIIRNSLPLDGRARSGSGRLVGQLGRGGAPVRLRTSNGSISLR